MEDNKKAKQIPPDTEIKYKVLYDSSRDAIMITIPEKGFISGNKAAVEMFGCKNESEFTSLTPATLSPEYQPDGELSSVKSQRMMKVAMEKGSHFFEWVHKRRNGEEFPANVLLSRMQLENQSILLATVRDTSDYKKAEEKLKQMAAEWDRTFNAISDSIFIQDANHTIIRVNAAFAKMMHAKPEDLIGKKCYELIHGLKKPWPDCPAEKTKIDKTPHVEEVDDPNIGIPLLVSTSPIINESGEVIGVVHISKDISAYKNEEKERAQLAA
ncbi:MAG: PAS domain-containing protein, partial [Candidatus Omnitrophica bacterium]|nr:PAS domain-containing protein [Candidatus Omnitrophota bacterium]